MLYFNPVSEPAQSIRTVLDIAGFSYELKEMDFVKKDHLSSDYLKIHPYHQIPAYSEGEACMIESASIMRYIA